MTRQPEAGARIRRGMALAAGHGVRMRPLTDSLPKPLIPVAGRALLDRVLDHFAAAGIEDAVVNTHHLGHLVAAHVAERRNPRIVLSPEERLLDTGGGVAQALPLLGDAAFVVANSDALWCDGAVPGIVRLMRDWEEERMDALLLMCATAEIDGYQGRGDYHLEVDGRLRRRGAEETVAFLFAGVQILHPRLFEGCPGGPFSLNLLWDRAQAAGRLFGLRHDGRWFHVGTPEALARTEAALARAGATPAARR